MDFKKRREVYDIGYNYASDYLEKHSLGKQREPLLEL
jgi:hypothetical protein